MRVVLADDEALLVEGLTRLLVEAGVEVVGKAATAPETLRCVALTRPDVAVIDIRMPPGHSDDGLVAAQEIRRRHPDVGVLVLDRPEPRVLHDILGFAGAAEHPVRNREQPRSMHLERSLVPVSCRHGSRVLHSLNL